MTFHHTYTTITAKNSLTENFIMKKYLIFMLNFIAIHTHAMETGVKSSNPIDLSLCSVGIQDLIASFLPFKDIEFEQEFIERTKALTIKKIPQEYHSTLPSPKFQCSASCPNNVMIVLLKRGPSTIQGWNQNEMFDISDPLVIIDRRNNQQTLYNISKFETKYSNPKIAISGDGNLIAYIKSELDLQTSSPLRHEIFFYNNVLTIINLSTNKTEQHDISDYFYIRYEHPTIAFNKQGTHIILHGNNQKQLYLPDDLLGQNPIPYHMIIPLTINTASPNADSKKTLAKYCAQRGICKNLITQITAKK